MTEFKKGMVVEIVSKSNTKSHFGWDSGMNKYIGRILQIASADNDTGTIIIKGAENYYFHSNDLKIPDWPESISIPETEKHVFDVNELY